MNEYKCETCKHGDLSVDRFPCDVCHGGGSQYEPEEGTAELKPCPFCGSAAELVTNTVGQFCVQCTNFKCGAVIIAEAYGDAVDAWNRREDGESHAD